MLRLPELLTQVQLELRLGWVKSKMSIKNIYPNISFQTFGWIQVESSQSI